MNKAITITGKKIMSKEDKDNFLKRFYQSVFSGGIIRLTDKDHYHDLKLLGLKRNNI